MRESCSLVTFLSGEKEIFMTKKVNQCGIDIKCGIDILQPIIGSLVNFDPSSWGKSHVTPYFPVCFVVFMLIHGRNLKVSELYSQKVFKARLTKIIIIIKLNEGKSSTLK